MWILREVQERGGEVDFREFMELALYHPEHGYYCSATTPWGRDGDYLTAPTASPWYGATCGRLLTELADATGEPLTLVDLAAGNGTFLASLLDSVDCTPAEILTAVVAVERSPARRREIAARSADVAVPVEVAPRFDVGPTGAAVVHASELYDAMPVHRVIRRGGALKELTVVAEGDRIRWGERLAGGDLESYLRGHGVALDDGQVAEINLVAEGFHRAVLDAAGEGLAMVLDYGYPAARLYDPRGRRRGSLATYRRHELGADPLANPGERDLTAHVNWDDLRRAASSSGWSEIGLMPLAEFLVRAGLGELVDDGGFGIDAELDADTVVARQEVKRLLDPEGMGSDLKVLIQGRGRLGEIAAELLSREV